MFVSKHTVKQYEERLIELYETIDKLREENDTLKNKLTDPHEVLQHILGPGLTWFDYDKISTKDEYNKYLTSAKFVRENPVFKNEINFLLSNLANKALFSPKIRDLEGPISLRDIRIAALMLEEVKDRFDSIPSPDLNPETPEHDPFQGV